MASQFVYLSEIRSYSHSIPCKKKSTPEGFSCCSEKGHFMHCSRSECVLVNIPTNCAAPGIVTTDASETHYASCLSQTGKDGVERPCGYSTKLLNSKESKQQPGMRERAALLHALRHRQPYIIGKEFILRTDHNPNLALAKGKMKSYDTLTDEILQFMSFKMEFMNRNKSDVCGRLISTIKKCACN